MLAALAPDVSASAGTADVEAAANETFASLESDNAVDFDTLQGHVYQQLDPEMDNKDLVAQLGALLVMDAVDLDQRDAEVRERTLDQAEWTDGATDLGSD